MISKTLRSVAADSNVLLSAAVGRAARRVFERIPRIKVVTPEKASGSEKKAKDILDRRSRQGQPSPQSGASHSRGSVRGGEKPRCEGRSAVLRRMW